MGDTHRLACIIAGVEHKPETDEPAWRRISRSELSHDSWHVDTLVMWRVMPKRTLRTMVPELLEFIHHLRNAGIPVSMVEAVDASRALGHVDMTRRAQVKATLASTLVKRADHRAIFESHFEIFFDSLHDQEQRLELVRANASRGSIGPTVMRSEFGAGSDDEEFNFLEVLLEALLNADESALRALAETAVREFGHIDAERSPSAKYYMHRIMKELDLGWLVQQARSRIREEASDEFGADVDVRAMELRIARFKERVQAEVQRSLSRDRGLDIKDALAAQLDVVEEIDFLGATPAQLKRMREAVRPLARRLAAKLAQRRKRRHRGRMDVRRTVRRSLASGGVPFDPAYRSRRESKPDLFLVADVSGSVSKFAEFTISFLNAMSDEFPKLRCFIFVDGVEEVTAEISEGIGLRDVKHLIARSKDISNDGHSDHARALEMFWTKYGTSITSTSTVIFTGDGRNNHRPDDAGMAVMRRLHDRAKHVYWLNPEPRHDWGEDDSVIPELRRFSTGLYEVRNLNQLQEFVLEIA